MNPAAGTSAGTLKLTPSETQVVERVLKMGGGYVLDFGDRTFSNFFATFDVDIDDQRFRVNGGSKANRLRTFLRISDTPLVRQVLSGLLEHGVETKFIGRSGPNFDALPPQEDLDRFRQIIARFEAATEGIPLVRAQPSAPDKSVKSADYEHILSVCASMADVMERDPKAYARIEEEHLRTHFLAQLNGHYPGGASGETFNYEGKTDILLRHDGKVAFVAECKFWSGPAAFPGIVDQLLGYTSWRDTKTAVLLFSRNRDTSAVVRQIPALLAGHPNHLRTLPLAHESQFRCVLRHRDDPGREVTLTVLVFDVPRAGTRRTSKVPTTPPSIDDAPTAYEPPVPVTLAPVGVDREEAPEPEDPDEEVRDVPPAPPPTIVATGGGKARETVLLVRDDRGFAYTVGLTEYRVERHGAWELEFKMLVITNVGDLPLQNVWWRLTGYDDTKTEKRLPLPAEISCIVRDLGTGRRATRHVFTGSDKPQWTRGPYNPHESFHGRNSDAPLKVHLGMAKWWAGALGVWVDGHEKVLQLIVRLPQTGEPGVWLLPAHERAVVAIHYPEGDGWVAALDWFTYDSMMNEVALADANRAFGNDAPLALPEGAAVVMPDHKVELRSVRVGGGDPGLLGLVVMVTFRDGVDIPRVRMAVQGHSARSTSEQFSDDLRPRLRHAEPTPWDEHPMTVSLEMREERAVGVVMGITPTYRSFSLKRSGHLWWTGALRITMGGRPDSWFQVFIYVSAGSNVGRAWICGREEALGVAVHHESGGAWTPPLDWFALEPRGDKLAVFG